MEGISYREQVSKFQVSDFQGGHDSVRKVGLVNEPADHEAHGKASGSGAPKQRRTLELELEAMKLSFTSSLPPPNLPR